jgi:hypothetical protein
LSFSSVADPHPFYAAPAHGKNVDAASAAPDPAPAPTLLYNSSKFLKEIKVNIRFDILLSSQSV